VTNLYVRLLAAGAWDENDQSRRAGLSRLLEALGSEDAPIEVRQQAPQEIRRRPDATAAVVMTLLVQDATFTGGSEHDVLAARSWYNSKAMIARAEPAEAEDLMFPPDQALARVAPWSEAGRLIALAQEDDPHAEVSEEFTAAGWSATREDGLWEITGSSGNPVPVAARAAGRLGRHHPNGALVQARSRNRWAFVAWAPTWSC